MTDSEASAPQDDSDEDIYKGFPEFNLEEELAKLEGSKESYKQEALDLSEKVKLLTEENKELKRLNEVLGKNISTLLKTAQNEVHRKDSLIEELRSKVDSITFRRSKRFGKDKFTTTEDLEPVNILKSECLECKKNRDEKRSKSKSKSYDNRTSSESESRSFKSDTRKTDRYCTKEENKDCDNEKRLGHFRDNLKLNYRHSGSDHDACIDKQRGSQFNRYSRRESIVGRRSYRQYDRHHSKFDSVDKREYTKRDSSESRFSLRRRDSDQRKNSRRDDSPEKPSRRGDTRRNRSRSKNRTSERKESSLDKGNRRGSLENDSLIRSKQEVRNKSKESESTRNSIKSDESNKRTESSERSKVNEKSKQVTKDRNPIKSEGRRNPDTFETKSPLDALYNEMIVTRSTTRLSNPKSSSTKADSEIEEGEYIEDKLEKSGSSDGSEEWLVPSKTEKPVTLYSKRMMEKISGKQTLVKEKESNGTRDTKGDSVSDEKEVSQIEEKNMKDSAETERESGELTDDENVIESSKEFQEIAKVASSVDNKINKKPGEGDRKKIPNTERVFFKEPFKTKTNNSTICNSIVGETKESRDIIEFSPFKNNYKLIEISPVKPPTKEHILDVYNKRLPSNSQTQKEVESKIFNLIMTLSGAPSDSDKPAEKTVTEENKATEISTCREDHQPEVVENPKMGGKMPSIGKTDERKHEPSSRRPNTRKSSKSKQAKAQDKPEKGQDKGKGKTEMENEVVDSVTPGETTQFLDFFLRTTSPSKPIVPAEQEMEIDVKQENGELNPMEMESEVKENSKTVVNTSSEKESLNSSPGEIQGKETHSKTKSPKSINSKSKKGKSPLKKRNSNSKEDSKEKETRETKREKSTELKKKWGQKNGSSDETSRGRNKRKMDRQDDEKEGREERKQKRKRTVSQRDEEAKKQKIEERKTCQKKSKRDSKSELEERVEETVKEDITSFEFFKPITMMETNGGDDANKSAGDYKMTTTMSLTGVVCLETPNKCVEKLMINEQAIYHFTDSKTNANATYSPLPCSKYPEMTPRRMLKNDLTLTDSDDSTNKQNQDEVDKDEAEEDEEVAMEGEGEVEMSENENSDYDSDSGASAFVDLL